MSYTPFLPLTSDSDWAAAREHSADTPVIIFKHSSACPVSTQADAEMTELATEVDIPIYRVVVQNHRGVSNIIETELGIRHETPQTIVLHEQSPVFDTSHFNVTADTLREELRRFSVYTH
jgi:bacillithiol system protein YtxJ